MDTIGCPTNLTIGIFSMGSGDRLLGLIPAQDAAGKNTGIGIDERRGIE